MVSGVANTYPTSYDDLLPGGTYNLMARYSGDTKYLPSSGTFTLTVTPEASRMLFWNGTALTASAPAATTIVYGSPVSVTVEPFSLNNNDVAIPTGTVGVYNNGSNDPMTIMPLSSEGTATFTSNLLTGNQTYSLVFGYAGDLSFGPSMSTANPYSVTVNQIATNTQVSAAGSAYTKATTVPSEVTAMVSPGLSIAAGSTVAVPGGFIADSTTYYTNDGNGQPSTAYTPNQTITVPANLPGAAPQAGVCYRA